jgi:hypothetical protein
MHSESERDSVCDKYEEYFAKKVADKDAAFMNELHRLWKYHKENGQLILGCYCSPKRCHGETIKRFLEQFP